MVTKVKTPKTKKAVVTQATHEKPITDPIHQRGRLSLPQAIEATRGTHTEWVQSQLEAESFIPLSWYRCGQLLELLEYAAHNPITELSHLRDLGELLSQFRETVPYDQEAWDTRRQFVCLPEYLNCNGKPPSLALCRLKGDPHKQQKTLPLEVASAYEEVDK